MDQVKNTWGRVENLRRKARRKHRTSCCKRLLSRINATTSKAGYKIVAHIHDEVVIEAPIGEGSLEEVIDIMCQTGALEWGLILNTAGFENPYYMKD